MNPTVYYHYWARNESPMYNNLRIPVLLSIATLRAVNPNLPIIVLEDDTDKTQPTDWLHFPEKLGFTVKPISFFLNKRYSHVKGYRYLSRLFDLRRHAESQDVLYCDLDVFWFLDPLPLACNGSDRFCFDGYNSGFFYYRPSETIEEFFDLFEAYTVGALNNGYIRELMKAHVGYESWMEVWDEMTLTFMREEHPSLIQMVPPIEHVTVRKLAEINPLHMKMLHCNGLMVANPVSKRPSEREHCRGLLCLIVKELYRLITSVLDEQDMKLIFTHQELKYFRPRQISLTDPTMIHQLITTRCDLGHFHIQKVCDALFKSQLLV